MNKRTVLIAVIVFFLGWIFSSLWDEKETAMVSKKEIVVRDTVVEYIEKEPIIIEKVRTKIVHKSDTIIKTVPFIASVDTVMMTDTIHADYEFPENLMSISLRKGMDSIIVRKVEVLKTVEEESPWWEAPAYILSGTVIGYLLGSAGK